jgi:hypothetical protein
MACSCNVDAMVLREAFFCSQHGANSDRSIVRELHIAKIRPIELLRVTARYPRPCPTVASAGDKCSASQARSHVQSFTDNKWLLVGQKPEPNTATGGCNWCHALSVTSQSFQLHCGTYVNNLAITFPPHRPHCAESNMLYSCVEPVAACPH